VSHVRKECGGGETRRDETRGGGREGIRGAEPSPGDFFFLGFLCAEMNVDPL